MTKIKDKVKQLSKDFLAEIITIRRHIHQNPELSFQEFETSKFFKAQLDKEGIYYTDNWVKTGIVATIKGKNPEKKTIALRGDLDALPIIEETSVDYISKNVGVMHACGHDVHSSCLFGAAKIINRLKNEFEGTVQFIFQPGEEKLPGGASLMLKEGLFRENKPNAIVAQHVFPDLEVGKVGFRNGMYMASCDEIFITVKGKGGHGAMPHNLIDPVLISAHLIVALQQIASRYCDPSIPCVLSIGRVEAPGATNVIPNEVKLQGTFRTMNEEWRAKAHHLIKSITEDLVASMKGTCDVEVNVGYPFLTNDDELTYRNRKLAQDYLGKENVVELPIRMTGEDFAFFSQQAPSCFYRLGVRNESEGIVHGVHNSHFNIDESAMEIGMGLMAFMAISE